MKKSIGMCMVVAGMVAVSQAQEYGMLQPVEKESGIYAGARVVFLNLKLTHKGDWTDEDWGAGTFEQGSNEGEFTKNIPGYAIALGYKFSHYLRFEAEGSGARMSLADNFGKSNLDFLMLKGLCYVDIPLEDMPMTPYVVLGLGYVQHKQNDYWFGSPITMHGLSLDIGLGASYSVAENLAIDAQCRFMTARFGSIYNIDDYRIGLGYFDEIMHRSMNAYLVSLGARYIF